KNWDSIKEYFTTGAGSKLWQSISSAAKELWSSLSTIFATIRDFAISVWEKIGTNVISYVQSAFNVVLSVVDGTIKYITAIINTFSALLKGDFRGALKGVGDIFKSVFDTIKNVGANVIGMVSQQIAGFLKLVGADGLGKSLEDFANSLTPVKS